MANRIQLRRDTTANWTESNPVLADGEMGYDIVTNEIRIGDGSTAWTELTANTISGGGGGGGASTGNVTFNDFTIIGTGNIHLQPDDQDSSYLDVFLTGGSDVHVTTGAGHLILGGDNAANVRLANDGNVQIQSYGASAKTWNLDTEGVLTLPASTSNVMIDATATGVHTLATDEAITFTNFSGMIIINDIFDGYVYTFIVGSGNTPVLLGTTNTNTVSSYLTFSGTGSGYVFTNKAASRDYNFVGIKTRNGA